MARFHKTELARALKDATPEQLKEALAFKNFAEQFFIIPVKKGDPRPMKLTRAQKIVDIEWERQWAERGYVRMAILKCRQVGLSTYMTRRAMYSTITKKSHVAMSLAHEKGLPEEWIRNCLDHIEIEKDGSIEIAKQVPIELIDGFRARLVGIKNSKIRLRNKSVYGIGSAQGSLPGMGSTIQFLHVSEISSWDKPPISVDPDQVLIPITPAVPTGDDIEGTVIVYESTGWMKGDYWHDFWMASKDPEQDYVPVFLPWYLVETYRSGHRAKSVIGYSPHEQWMKSIAKSAHGLNLTDAQIAWYRSAMKEKPFFGNAAKFAAAMPTTEDEAFMSPGESVYDSHHVEIARATVRKPEYRMHLHESEKMGGSPFNAVHDKSDSGEVLVWEEPNPNYHYVLGQDCMWGRSATSDYAVGYVECLETNRLCAKFKGQWSMPKQAWYGAALGHWYNDCPVAPERNARAGSDGEGVIATLLGSVHPWRYSNIWIRSPQGKFSSHSLTDYGWYTDARSKSQAVATSIGMTVDRNFDWCDEAAVDQMGTIIHGRNGNPQAPEGAHDDDWVARLITAEVARLERKKTRLYVETPKQVIQFRTPAVRLAETVAAINQDDDDWMDWD